MKWEANSPAKAKPKIWRAALITHDNQKRIAVYFEKDATLNESIKKLVGAKWSQRLKAWHLPDNITYRKQFGIELNSPNQHVEDVTIKEQLNIFSDWMKQKRYSLSTVNTYCKTLQVFFGYYKNMAISALNNDHVFNFNKNYILQKKLSATYQSQFINALKLFYSRINDHHMIIENLERPAKPHSLPKVISEEEVAELINATENLKHKSMLSLIYSAGLRRSELLNMKLTDIDSKRMMITINEAKGMKDRLVPLSPSY